MNPHLFRLRGNFLSERLVFGRVFFQSLGACIIQPVRRVDSFTVFVTVCHHPSKVCLCLEEVWVKSGYLQFYIYYMRFVLLLGMFDICGSLVFTLFSSGFFIWDCSRSSSIANLFIISSDLSLLLMSIPSPTSPLSFSSSTDGCVDNQNDVSSPYHPPQSEILSMLDGCQSDYHDHPSNSKLPSYSSILKLRVGGNCSTEVPPVESELRP